MYLKSSPSHFAQFSLTMGCYTLCSMVRVATSGSIVVAKKSFGNVIRDKSGTSTVFPFLLQTLYYPSRRVSNVRPIHNTSVNWGSTGPSEQNVHFMNQRCKFSKFQMIVRL